MGRFRDRLSPRETRRRRYRAPSARGYATALRSIARQTWEDILPGVERMLASLPEPEERPTTDRRDEAIERGVKAKIDDEVAKLRLRLGKVLPPSELRALVEGFGGNIDRYAGREVGRLIPQDLWADADVGPMLAQWTADNLDLIVSVQGQMLDRVREQVIKGTESGARVEDIRAGILERVPDLARSRADLIARDQVGKLFSRATETRHKAAGISEYFWSTSKDGVVRPKHAEREGKRFRYDTPPDGGPPGWEFQCRCTAVPVIPGLDDDEPPITSAVQQPASSPASSGVRRRAGGPAAAAPAIASPSPRAAAVARRRTRSAAPVLVEAPAPSGPATVTRPAATPAEVQRAAAAAARRAAAAARKAAEAEARRLAEEAMAAAAEEQAAAILEAERLADAETARRAAMLDEQRAERRRLAESIRRARRG